MGPKWESKSEQVRKKTEKGCSKIDGKKIMQIWRRNGINPCFSEGPFWSWRGGKEGTSPSGTGDFGFDSVFNLKRPAPGGVRRIFHEKWSLERPRVDLFSFLKGF